MTELVHKFETYLRNVRNCSELTVSAYCADICEFLSVMADKAFLNEITCLDIETRYIEKLVASGAAPATRARKISSVKSFFKWASKCGYVMDNVSVGIETPKIPHKEPKIMSREEVHKTMNAVSKVKQQSIMQKDNFFRDMAIIHVMFTTGMRRAEITEVKLCDVDLKESSILVHGKGNKERIVFFNENTKRILSEYMLSHRNLYNYAKTSEYLFISDVSEKLNVCTINRIVNAKLEQAGIKGKGYTAHSTRKAFATEVYSNTHDIYVVQKLLGHSNIATTQRYVSAFTEVKKQAAMTVSF